MKCPRLPGRKSPGTSRCDCGHEFLPGIVEGRAVSPEGAATSRLTPWYWPEASPATYERALVFGWMLVACAAVYAGIAVFLYLHTFGADLAQDAALEPWGLMVGWVALGIFTLATGLAVLRKRVIAVRLVWWWIIVSGLGVVGRLAPLEIMGRLAFLWVAKWYSTKKPLLTS